MICALKRNPYRGCDALEDRSGNDNSPSSLKAEQARLLKNIPSRESLCQLVQDRTVDIDRITMPGFMAFRQRLEEVI